MADRIGKIDDGTLITFKETGGDAALTLSGLASGGVRASAEFDRGVGFRDEWMTARIVIKGFTADAGVGSTVDLYIYTSRDGAQTTRDGNLPGTDVTLAASIDEQTLPNLEYVISAVVISATPGDPIVAKALVRLPDRHIGVSVHNNTGAALAAATHEVTLETFVPTYTDP